MRGRSATTPKRFFLSCRNQPDTRLKFFRNLNPLSRLQRRNRIQEAVMKKFIFVLSLSLTGIAAAQSPSASQVIMDWEQFSKLWQEAQRPTETPGLKPPVDFILGAGRYDAVIGAHAAEISAEFELNVLKDGWVRVPFLPDSIGLQNVTVNDQPAMVVRADGAHNVVLSGTGPRQIRATFTLPRSGGVGAPALEIPIRQTAVTLLSITVPQPGLNIAIEPAQALTCSTEDGKTRAKAVLRPTQRIFIRWRTEATARPPRRKSSRKRAISSRSTTPHCGLLLSSLIQF
jgi:hypothetical protein